MGSWEKSMELDHDIGHLVPLGERLAKGASTVPEGQVKNKLAAYLEKSLGMNMGHVWAYETWDQSYSALKKLVFMQLISTCEVAKGGPDTCPMKAKNEIMALLGPTNYAERLQVGEDNTPYCAHSPRICLEEGQCLCERATDQMFWLPFDYKGEGTNGKDVRNELTPRLEEMISGKFLKWCDCCKASRVGIQGRVEIGSTEARMVCQPGRHCYPPPTPPQLDFVDDYLVGTHISTVLSQSGIVTGEHISRMRGKENIMDSFLQRDWPDTVSYSPDMDDKDL